MQPSADWYPSPTVSGRDQWWNGHAWTPKTRARDTTAPIPELVPPPESAPGILMGIATSPVALLGAIVGLAAITVNPLWILSVVAFALSTAAIFSMRAAPMSAARLGVVLVGALGILASVIGAAVELGRWTGWW